MLNTTPYKKTFNMKGTIKIQLPVAGKTIYHNLQEVVTEFQANELFLNQEFEPFVFVCQEEIETYLQMNRDLLLPLNHIDLNDRYTFYQAAYIKSGTITPQWSLTKECKIDQRYEHLTVGRIYTEGKRNSEIVCFTDDFRDKLRNECHRELGVVFNVNQTIDNLISLIKFYPKHNIYYWLFYFGIAIGRKEESYLVFYDLIPKNVPNELGKILKEKLTKYVSNDK